MSRAAIATLLVCWGLSQAMGQDNDRQAADKAAISKAVDSYVAAYNRGDAKALAALWSPEAVYTIPVDGEQVVGREAIEKQFAAIFADAKAAKLEAKTESIDFVSPNVVVERGTARLAQEGQPSEDSTYTAVYTKRDGQWLLDRVTEDEAPVVPSHYEQLKELEWMIGAWVDQDDQSRIETTCQWTKNQNFMTRSFTISVRDQIQLAGMQIVGWDPAAKRIRSWVFDSDGGFGEGSWSKKAKAWYIQSVGTLPDGTKTSAVNVITQADDNKFTWQSINRESGGELLPNVDEVVVVRQTKGE